MYTYVQCTLCMNVQWHAHTFQRVAPRGWTREINPITSTPIYTNSRTGERWTLAKDGVGNYYYYNMSNPRLTVGELPEGTAAQPDDPMYINLSKLHALTCIMYMYMYFSFPSDLWSSVYQISEHKALGVVLLHPTLVAYIQPIYMYITCTL